MSRPLGPLDRLVHESFDADGDGVSRLVAECATALAGCPALDQPFADRYLTRSADEWEQTFALRVFGAVGRHRVYDIGPLAALFGRSDITIHFKRAAATCLTRLADRLDDAVYRDLLSTLTNELRQCVACKLTDALAGVRDRAKAGRLLRLFLAQTAVEGRQQLTLLDQVKSRTHGNEDVYHALLSERLAPHETVLVAVSLMHDTLPADGPLRDLADTAAAQSRLADDYFCLYVGRYVGG